MSATYGTLPGELDGSSAYAYCDAIEAHPRAALAHHALSARGLIATTAKMKRYQSVVLGPLAPVERHRETRSLEVYTVDQLLAWGGYGADEVVRDRWIARAMRFAEEGKAHARPLELLLDTGSDEQKQRWISLAPPMRRFTSHPWTARALAGEDEPGAALITHVSASRRAPVEWARALCAQRARFGKNLQVELRMQDDDDLSREALELLAHAQLEGLSLFAKRPQSSYAPYAGSLPEGLRSLSLGSVTREDIASLAAQSALRSIENLSLYTGNPCALALAALLASFDQRRSLTASLHNNEVFALQAIAEGCDLRELEALELTATEVGTEDLRALMRACASGSLRRLRLGYVTMGEAIAEEFASSSTLSGVESIVFDPKISRDDRTAIDRFTARLASAGVRRFEWKCYTRDEPRMQRALDAIANNPSFAPLETLTLDSIDPSCAPMLRALLDQRRLRSLDLSVRGEPSPLLRAIAESRSARTLRSLTLGTLYLSAEGLAPLCESEALAGLESLSIAPSQLTVAMVEQFAKSPMARSLCELSIFSSQFAAGVIRALCDSGLDSTLARLTIAYRYFGPEELWELKRTFGAALQLV